jgi:MFS family permease
MEYGDAINNAIERTKYLLWERRSKVRWRNYAFLSVLAGANSGGGGGGGGGDFSSLFKGSDHHDSSMRVMLGCSLAGALGLGAQAGDGLESIKPYMALIILFVLAMMVFAVGMTFASNFARVILVENIVHDREAIVEPWGRLSRLGWSVLWWGVGFVIVTLMLLGLLCGVPFGVVAVMAEGGNSGALLLLIPLFFWFLALLIPLCFVNGYFQEIVVPLMYRQNITANEAWALFKPMFKAQKMRWIGYMVIHFFLCMAGGIATSLAGLLVVMVVGIVLAVPTAALWYAGGTTIGILCACIAVPLFIIVWICVFALFGAPVTVAARSFSMYILQQVAPEYGFLPLGGRPLQPAMHGLEVNPAGTGLNPADSPRSPAETPTWSEEPPAQP